jgi:hypothetical protein
MGIRRGSISTPIIVDGLVFNFDAANRASYVNGSTKTFNTINLSQSGSLENSPTFISSPAAWDFDGSDTYINCGDIEMDGITGLTVEAWCKSDVTDSNQRRIVSKDQQGTQGAWILLVQSGDLKWQTHDGAFKIASYGSYSEDTNWHHIVGTLRDGTNTLYLDGAAVASIGSVGALDDADNEEIVIGADSDVGANTFLWNGQIANVKIYNRGLSPSEVLHNYNALKGRFGL